MQKREIIDKLRKFCEENAYNLILDYTDDYEYSTECLGIAFEGSSALALANISEFFRAHNLEYALDDYNEASYLLGKIIYFPQVRLIEYVCIGKTAQNQYCIWNKQEDTVSLMDMAQVIMLEELGYNISKKDKYAPGTCATVKGIPIAFKSVSLDGKQNGFFIKEQAYYNTEEGAAAIAYFAYMLGQANRLAASNIINNFKESVTPKITYFVDNAHCVWVKAEDDKFELRGITKVAKNKEIYDNIPKRLTAEELAQRAIDLVLQSLQELRN
jgi:hypothetical protein